MKDMYQIAYENQDIVIRLPKDSVSKEALTDLLDYLQIESIKSRSALTENQVDSLAEVVDQQVWQSLKKITGIKS